MMSCSIWFNVEDHVLQLQATKAIYVAQILRTKGHNKMKNLKKLGYGHNWDMANYYHYLFIYFLGYFLANNTLYRALFTLVSQIFNNPFDILKFTHFLRRHHASSTPILDCMDCDQRVLASILPRLWYVCWVWI